MKILLLQDALHLPSHGGGNKANRMLLEALAAAGHECKMVSRATNRSVYLTERAELEAEWRRLGIEVDTDDPGQFRYRFGGVEVRALASQDEEERARRVRSAIERFEPDVLLVSDDREMLLVRLALERHAARTFVLIHTLFHLPFGPHAARPDAAQTELLREAHSLLTVSRFVQRYLEEHAGLASNRVLFPVYGGCPFPQPSDPDTGFVTLINPCPIKGVDLFLELARSFRETAFAAVPTWGREPGVLERLRAQRNVTLLPSADDLGEVLRRTRVLVAPSVVEETFGYVVPEAMLRGIPVLAADIGGMPEAKLGVDYLLPVQPAVRGRDGFVVPPQDSTPWRDALGRLLTRPALYDRIAEDSRRAATEFVGAIGTAPFERLFERARRENARRQA